jgi:formate hydrogenlyase subunit 3/multisubunit Na+/H+ antiporter MnhD subunit
MNFKVELPPVVLANLGSWGTSITAFVHIQDVSALIAIGAGLGSMAVSLFSVLWLRKQMRGYDKHHGTGN